MERSQSDNSRGGEKQEDIRDMVCVEVTGKIISPLMKMEKTVGKIGLGFGQVSEIMTVSFKNVRSGYFGEEYHNGVKHNSWFGTLGERRGLKICIWTLSL